MFPGNYDRNIWCDIQFTFKNGIIHDTVGIGHFKISIDK